ncbi:MAG TPA: hypothetical protein PLF11_00170 [Bacillota bacterium]|nr:hypothetical protein [Bacillota bacterium]
MAYTVRGRIEIQLLDATWVFMPTTAAVQKKCRSLIEADQSEESYDYVFETLLVGWRDVCGPDGQSWDFTPEHVAQIPWSDRFAVVSAFDFEQSKAVIERGGSVLKQLTDSTHPESESEAPSA